MAIYMWLFEYLVSWIVSCWFSTFMCLKKKYLVVGYRKIVIVRDYDYIICGADVVSYRDPIEDNSPFPRATYVIAVGLF